MGNYKKKGNKREYTEDERKNVLKAVQKGQRNGKSIKQICKEHGVPYNTVLRWQTYNKNCVLGTGRSCVFSADHENLIVIYLVYCAAYGFPQAEHQLQQMIKSFVAYAKIKNPFENGIPGRYWLKNFKKRNHEPLRTRNREGLSIGRAKSLTPSNISQFFIDTYKPLYDLYGLQFKPHCIWNLDETAFQALKNAMKVFVGSVSKNAYSLTSNSTKGSFTVLFCGSAAGVYLPPFTIYKSKSGLTRGAVTGGAKDAAYGFTPSGWMEGPTFQTWFCKFFLPAVKKVDAHSAHILFYDGHNSHLTYETFHFAKQYNVHIICLPPNSSHATQPLDVGVFKSVKQVYSKIVQNWWTESNYQNIDRNVFPLLLKQLWAKLDSTWIVNGFKKTGLYPFNANALADKTIHSVDDDDIIFKQTKGRKPGLAEKALIKAVKESLKPKANAAVQSAVLKRNNLKRIQCLPGEVMTEASSMDRIQQHEKDVKAKKAAKGKGKGKAAPTPQAKPQGVSISVKPPQDNGPPKRKCANTLDTFVIKRSRVVDAPVQVVKSTFGSYESTFAPSIAEPEVINNFREDTEPIISTISVSEQSLLNTFYSDYVQVVKSNFSPYVHQLTLSKLETLHEYYPPINLDQPPIQIPPPIIHLDDNAIVFPLPESEIDEPDTSEIETDSDDEIPIKYRLPSSKVELYNKLRSGSTHIICGHKGQQIPGLVTKKLGNTLMNIKVKLMTQCVSSNSCSTLWKWTQEANVATVNVASIVALIPPPHTTSNSARNYLVPRMANSLKVVYKANS